MDFNGMKECKEWHLDVDTGCPECHIRTARCNERIDRIHFNRGDGFRLVRTQFGHFLFTFIARHVAIRILFIVAKQQNIAIRTAAENVLVVWCVRSIDPNIQRVTTTFIQTGRKFYCLTCHSYRIIIRFESIEFTFFELSLFLASNVKFT